jgi:hypothetical protein
VFWTCLIYSTADRIPHRWARLPAQWLWPLFLLVGYSAEGRAVTSQVRATASCPFSLPCPPSLPVSAARLRRQLCWLPALCRGTAPVLGGSNQGIGTCRPQQRPGALTAGSLQQQQPVLCWCLPGCRDQGGTLLTLAPSLESF